MKGYFAEQDKVKNEVLNVITHLNSSYRPVREETEGEEEVPRTAESLSGEKEDESTPRGTPVDRVPPLRQMRPKVTSPGKSGCDL